MRSSPPRRPCPREAEDLAQATKPGIGRAVILPASVALVLAGVLMVVFGSFLNDPGPLLAGLIPAWLCYTSGRALAHFDRPRGRGLFLRHVLLGLALGLTGMGILHVLFANGPGWPWTPLWVLAGGLGFGLFRAHKPILKDARATQASDTKRWMGFLHPKDVQALSILLVGYGLMGLSAFLVFRAFSGLIPSAGKALSIGIAIYALQGARLLLAFASEERGKGGEDALGWVKANALQLAIVFLVLVAYATFRDQLAGTIPFYPLIEFGLGMAVFGFVLARLRSKLRRDGTPLASASEARDHQRIVTELREPDYDAVARPVTRFIESGLGQAEYADALSSSLPPEHPRAQEVRAAVARHQEPPRPPALDMTWSFAAGAALTLGLAIAAIALGVRLFHADMPIPLFMGLLFIGFGVYAQQDAARTHHRPWLAVGIAAAGASIILLDFLLFVGHVASIFALPRIVWAIVVGVFTLFVGIPALTSWRHHKRLRSGQLVDARRIAPALEHANEQQKTRKRAATMTLVAFIILLPVPWFAGWLADRGIIPEDFPPFLRDVLGVAIWIIAAFGASAIVRFYGLTRGKPQLLAREKAKRDRRLSLHKELVSSLERA